MANQCHFTGKKTSFGKTLVYRGQKIVKGGFGLKPTGISPRTFKPNLQSVRVELTDASGKKRVERVKASAKAIRTGLVVKALPRKYGYTLAQKQGQD